MMNPHGNCWGTRHLLVPIGLGVVLAVLIAIHGGGLMTRKYACDS